MTRALSAGALLLFLSAAAARHKQERPVFVFLGVNQERNVAMLRPMIAPDIGVQLDSGIRGLKPGDALRCTTLERNYKAIVEGQSATVTDLVLDCGENKFVVKGIDFTPGTK